MITNKQKRAIKAFTKGHKDEAFYIEEGKARITIGNRELVFPIEGLDGRYKVSYLTEINRLEKQPVDNRVYRGKAVNPFKESIWKHDILDYQDAKILSKLVKFTSDEESRLNMQKFHIKDNVVFTTDGRRLGWSKDFTVDKDLTLSWDVTGLEHLVEEISITDHNVYYRAEDWELQVKREGYCGPPYERVIPNYEKTVSFDLPTKKEITIMNKEQQIEGVDKPSRLWLSIQKGVPIKFNLNYVKDLVDLNITSLEMGVLEEVIESGEKVESPQNIKAMLGKTDDFNIVIMPMLFFKKDLEKLGLKEGEQEVAD